MQSTPNTQVQRIADAGDDPRAGARPRSTRRADRPPRRAGRATKPLSPGHRNPESIVLAKLISAVSGDKYMIGAHPPTRPPAHPPTRPRGIARHSDVVTRDDHGLVRVNHDG